MDTNYVQGPGWATTLYVFSFLRCSEIHWGVRWKKNRSHLRAATEIGAKYPRRTEEGTTFSSWIQTGNSTEQVKASERQQVLYLKKKRGRKVYARLSLWRKMRMSREASARSPAYPIPGMLLLSLNKYLLARYMNAGTKIKQNVNFMILTHT